MKKIIKNKQENSTAKKSKCYNFKNIYNSIFSCQKINNIVESDKQELVKEFSYEKLNNSYSNDIHNHEIIKNIINDNFLFEQNLISNSKSNDSNEQEEIVFTMHNNNNNKVDNTNLWKPFDDLLVIL